MFQTYVQEWLWALLPQVTISSPEVWNQLRALANNFEVYTALMVIQEDVVKQELEAVQTSIDKGYKKVHKAVHATNTVFRRLSTDVQGTQVVVLGVREEQGRQHNNSVSNLLTELKNQDQQIAQLRANIRHIRKWYNNQVQYQGNFVAGLEEQYSKANVQQAIDKTGFTANKTDTSQDTESSASATAQEEPSQQPSEGTRDGTNTRTQTHMVLIESGSSSTDTTGSE
jgi:hypothetical protein